MTATPKFRALVSADWNQCLAPCGPFDCMGFVHPQLRPALASIFQQYTANRISLGAAQVQLRSLLPGAIGADEMDAYLAATFNTYTDVANLIEWCAARRILFMINTTGMQGYFQRALAKKLLPPIPVLSANPTIRFPSQSSDPSVVIELHEIDDKPRHTAAVQRRFGIPNDKVALLGDSGGDGPHFKWGAAQGALLIGSMTKPSLDQFCRAHSVDMDLHFGLTYTRDTALRPAEEMQVDFMQLTGPLQALLDGGPTAR
ncbi:MAG: hypothetical protein GKR89_06865 [Candidatus Latescibacteria bacterium]|nr:hypothetical protein [Candidatus Latescibacterota bacterium]